MGTQWYEVFERTISDSTIICGWHVSSRCVSTIGVTFAETPILYHVALIMTRDDIVAYKITLQQPVTVGSQAALVLVFTDVVIPTTKTRYAHI